MSVRPTLFIAAIVMAVHSYGQELPGWRFWDADDDMAEPYSSRVVAVNRGVWVKHGTVPLDLLDGYRAIHGPSPEASGPFCTGPGETFWIWGGRSLKYYRNGNWSSFAVPEITGRYSLRLDAKQNWTFTSHGGPRLPVNVGLAALTVDRVILLLPDRLLQFDASAGRATAVFPVEATGLEEFREIRARRGGGFWVTGRRGLGWVTLEDRWHWQAFQPVPPTASDFRELYEGEDGGLLITATASTSAIWEYSAGKWRQLYTGGASLLSAWPGMDGARWIRDGDQILELSNGQATPVPRLGPLSGSVLSIEVEAPGRFWVATSQGLAYHAPPIWQTPAEVRRIDDTVSSIMEDRHGRIWFISTSTLICLDKNRWQLFPLPNGQQAWAIFTRSLVELPDGRIAIRTTFPNILTFDPGTGRFEVTRHPEGRDTRMFLATPAGMMVETTPPGDMDNFRLEDYDGREFRVRITGGQSWGLKDLRVLQSTRSGDLWAGSTTGFGVYRNGRFEHVGIEAGYTDDSCYLVWQSPSGQLYAGGRHSLFVLQGKFWHWVKGGLDRIRTMAESADGAVWVASGNGIGRIRNGQWLSNTFEDGLPSDVAYTVFQDSRGRVWAGTTRGLSLYHPDADHDPPTVEIPEDQNTSQTPVGGEFRAIFAGRDKWKQTPPDRLLFSWRMDGSEWTNFAPAGSAAFKSLPPGRKTFQVRAMDRNGNVSPQPATFTFSVPVPWYQMRTVQVIIFVLAASIAILLTVAVLNYRYRGRLIRELQRKKRLELDRQAILEMVARRTPLDIIFQRIVRSIVVNCPGVQCAVLRMNAGKLEVTASPGLDKVVRLEIETLAAGASDFQTLWKDLGRIAKRHGIADYHFAPIRVEANKLAGAIAVFGRARSVVDVPVVASLAGLAVASIDSAQLYHRLEYQAMHDALTGLPNRNLFEARLETTLAGAVWHDRTVAVFFVDLDGFKQVNDSLGHRTGDLLLKEVARRFTEALPRGETLARVGGDEFTILLEHCAGIGDAENIARQLLDSLRPAWIAEGRELFVSASIGISLAPRDGADAVSLQKHADVAMYQAKSQGKNRYQLYSPMMPEETAGRVT